MTKRGSAISWMLQRRRDEKGAYAVLMSMTLVLVIALAAIAVDIASQVESKQRLKDTMDAAAHAAAFELGDEDPSSARSAAIAAAKANDPDADPEADFWCVVAATNTTPPMVSEAQIPGTCYPGEGPYTAANYPGLVCTTTHCFIPCVIGPNTKCNTIRVWDQKSVDYAFAPAIGFDQGSTGAVVSVACSGTCGSDAPNPMDVVIMADRTASMKPTDRAGMVSGIKDMLTVMTPSMQFVSFGALHKSKSSAKGGSCPSSPTRKSSEGVQDGDWIAVPFSNDYHRVAAGPTTLNANSQLFKAVDCLPESPSGEFGTHLASPMKAAARYVLGKDPNNVSTLNAANPRPGTPKKVVIFETDGMPDEVWKGGNANLGSAGDVGAGTQDECRSYLFGIFCQGANENTNGQKGCDNFAEVARQAKAEGVTIVTIGFGDANTARCKKFTPHTGAYASSYVRDVLAKAASAHPKTGQPSAADNDCDTQAKRDLENTDGDFYFCAANGSELSEIFQTALSSINGGIKFFKMPR